MATLHKGDDDDDDDNNDNDDDDNNNNNNNNNNTVLVYWSRKQCNMKISFMIFAPITRFLSSYMLN